jgi:hypothetical protein
MVSVSDGAWRSLSPSANITHDNRCYPDKNVHTSLMEKNFFVARAAQGLS